MKQTITLNSGAEMPVLGLGTWKAEVGKVGEAVRYALTEAGYRHVDCAWIYRNQREIGVALKEVFDEGLVKREDVFITSKLWNSFHARENVLTACKETLQELQLDYLDLFLVHWGVATPPGETEPLDENGVIIQENVPMQETWEAMEELVRAGLVKSIGVSNFTAPMLIDLLTYAKILPAVNQIELHPYLQQRELIEFCRYKGILPVAYSPLGRPGAVPPRPHMKPDANSQAIVDNPVIVDLANRYQKTPSQILLRWALQRKTSAIPKSTNPEHLKENTEIFDFELSDEDMGQIASLNRNHRYVDPYEWWKIPYFDC